MPIQKRLAFLILGILICPSIGSYSQTVPTPEPIAQGAHESVHSCLAKYGQPECYCGAYANETRRETAVIGSMKVLAVSFQTDEIVSGDGKNFGCYYLTPFKAPAGYVLSGYQFNTNTGFGPCQLRLDRMQGIASEGWHGENWQECGVNPATTDTAVQFKFRMQGSDDKHWVGAIDFQHFPGAKFSEEEVKGRNIGSASMTLFFVPK